MFMNDGTKGIINAIESLKGSIDSYQTLAKRVNELEDRMHDMETELIKYRNFIEKTDGFFTRAGFYGDAAIMWLRAKFKK